jgi:MFS family permease
LVVLLLFSVAAPLNHFRVPRIMPLLLDALELSVGRAGLSMSVFAVTGLILALPSGFMFPRAGFRLTGLLAGGGIVFGAALGALSQSAGLLLASRVIEGMGTRFMAVLALAIIDLTLRGRGSGESLRAFPETPLTNPPFAVS